MNDTSHRKPISEILSQASGSKLIYETSLLRFLQDIASMKVGHLFTLPDNAHYYDSYLDDISFTLRKPTEYWKADYEFYGKTLFLMIEKESK